MAMPMSLVGTFVVMYLLGYSLDNLSLMALILAVGFVVDDAIVMLENIVRHLEMGEAPVKAALNGSREIGFTIVSMTLSLVAVFIPVLFMGGILGRLFQEFAVTIGVAILISGAVSLTLTPMLCSRFLKSHSEHPPGRFFNASERVFEAMLSLYRRSLGWFLDHRRITIGILVLVLCGTVVLLRLVPARVHPERGSRHRLRPDRGGRGDLLRGHEAPAAGRGRGRPADPNVEAFMSNAGRARAVSRGGNTGSSSCGSSRASERELSADQVIQNLRPKLAQIPGHPGLSAEPAAHLGRRPGDQEPVPVHAAGPRHRGALPHRAAGGLERVQATARVSGRDHRSAAEQPAGQRRHRPRQGLLARGLGRADRGRALQRLRRPADLDHLRRHNQYQVILELMPEYQRDAAALSLLYVRSSSGALVPLDALARITRGRRSAVRQPHRPTALGDDLLQPEARRMRWATP